MGTPLIQLLDGLPVTCHAVTPELHVGDLVEDRVDDVLHVALEEMRVLGGNDLHEFRFDHVVPFLRACPVGAAAFLKYQFS